MSDIAVLVGNPRKGTYCAALAEAYAQGARQAGHTVDVINLADLYFDPILHEGFDKLQPLEPGLRAAHDAVLAARHLVIIFPLWLGGMPALLSGFLERVFQGEFLETKAAGKFRFLLKGKSARVITTMGMPGFLYKLWFGSHGLKVLKQSILHWSGVWPVRTSIY